MADAAFRPGGHSESDSKRIWSVAIKPTDLDTPAPIIPAPSLSGRKLPPPVATGGEGAAISPRRRHLSSQQTRALGRWVLEPDATVPIAAGASSIPSPRLPVGSAPALRDAAQAAHNELLAAAANKLERAAAAGLVSDTANAAALVMEARAAVQRGRVGIAAESEIAGISGGVSGLYLAATGTGGAAKSLAVTLGSAQQLAAGTVAASGASRAAAPTALPASHVAALVTALARPKGDRSLPVPGGVAAIASGGSPLTLRQRDLLSRSGKLINFTFPRNDSMGSDGGPESSARHGDSSDRPARLSGHDGHDGSGGHRDASLSAEELPDVFVGPNEAIAALQQRLVQQRAEAAAAAREAADADRQARWGALDELVTQQIAGGVGAATSAAELGMSAASRALLISLEHGSSIDTSLQPEARSTSTAAAAAALLRPGAQAASGGHGSSAAESGADVQFSLSFATTAAGGVSPRARGLKATAREAAQLALPPRMGDSEKGEAQGTAYAHAPLARAAVLKALTGARTAAGLPPRLDSAGLCRRSVVSVASLSDRPPSRHMALATSRSSGEMAHLQSRGRHYHDDHDEGHDDHHQGHDDVTRSRPATGGSAGGSRGVSLSPPSRGSSFSPSRGSARPGTSGRASGSASGSRPSSRGAGAASAGRVRLQPLPRRPSDDAEGERDEQYAARAAVGADSQEHEVDSKESELQSATAAAIEDHPDGPRLSSAGWPFAVQTSASGSSGPTLEAARLAIRRASILIDSVALPTDEHTGSQPSRHWAGKGKRAGTGSISLSPYDSAARMRKAPLVHGVVESQRVQAARRGDTSAKHAQLQEWLLFAGELGLSTGAMHHRDDHHDAHRDASSMSTSVTTASEIVAGEARLQSARAFSEPMGRPADLPTAAAFALMDAILSTMGRAPQGSLAARCAAPLRECQAVLLQATYAELALGPQASASVSVAVASADSETHGRRRVGIGAATQIGRGVSLLAIGPSATEEITQAGFPPVVIQAAGAAAAAQQALAAPPLSGGPLSSPLRFRVESESMPMSPQAARAFAPGKATSKVRSHYGPGADAAGLTLHASSPQVGSALALHSTTSESLALFESSGGFRSGPGSGMPSSSFLGRVQVRGDGRHPGRDVRDGPLHLRRYYGLSSYAALSAALAAERDLLSAALGELAATLEAWEGARKREIAGSELKTRIARKWQLLAFRELRRRQAVQQAEVIESQRQNIASLQLLLAPGAEAVTAAFARLPSDSDRTGALLSVLSAAAASWAPALRFLVTQLPLDVLLRLLGSALSERADLGLSELASFMAGMMKTPRVKGAVVTVSAADGAAAGAAPAGDRLRLGEFGDATGDGAVTSRATSRGRGGIMAGSAPPPPPRPSSTARATARGSATSRAESSGGGYAGDHHDASDAIGLDSPHGGLAETSRFALPKLAPQPAPSVPSSGQAFVIREIVAGLSGTEWSGLLPALLPALASHDAAAALRYLCGLDAWPLPPRDLRRHVTGGTPPQAPPAPAPGSGHAAATSRTQAASGAATSRASASAGAGVTARTTVTAVGQADVWRPVPGVRTPAPANAFQAIITATSKAEQGVLLRLLLRRAGATAWHAFLDALLPSRSSRSSSGGGSGSTSASSTGRRAEQGSAVVLGDTGTSAIEEDTGSKAAAAADSEADGTAMQGQLADAIRTADAASKAAALSLIAEGMSAEDLSLALRATVTLLPGNGTRQRIAGEDGVEGQAGDALSPGGGSRRGERARSARRSISGQGQSQGQGVSGDSRGPSRPRSRANSVSSAANSERGSDEAAGSSHSDTGVDGAHRDGSTSASAGVSSSGLLVSPLHLRAPATGSNAAAGAGAGSGWTGLSTRSPLFLRYVASPVRLPRGTRPLPRLRAEARLRAEEALAIVYDAYAAKAAEDLALDNATASASLPATGMTPAASAAASKSIGTGTSDGSLPVRGQGHPLMQSVQPLSEWLRGHLLRRCGIPSAADAHLLALADAVRRLAPRSARLRMFGRVSGLIEGSRSGEAAGAGLPGDAALGGDSGAYSQRAGTLLLALLQGAMPGFSARDLRDLPEGRAFVPLDDALAATEAVFTRYNVAAATRRIMLTSGRKALLTKAVRASAEPYADAAAAAAAAAATSRGNGAGAATSADAPPASVSVSGMRRSSSRASAEEGTASLAGFNDLGALAPAIASTVSKGTSVQGSRAIQPTRLVVDLDVWLSLCMSVWQAQVTEDAAGVGRLFRTFAGDRPIINVDVSHRDHLMMWRVC